MICLIRKLLIYLQFANCKLLSRYLVDVLGKDTYMKKEILDKLKEIEREKGVRVLLAVESGSRAWGFASPDSDYDVRFIYVHKPEWYLSVAKQPDTIEYMSDDRIFDLSGWELRKTLTLLSKTNPNLSDWLLTDLVYMDNPEFLQDIRRVQDMYYNPIHAMYHFFSIAKRHDEGYLHRNGCTLKKFLYFLRGVLACEYISKHRAHPPVNFRTMVNETVSDPRLLEEIDDILVKKSKSKEHDTQEVHAVLQKYAFSLYNYWEKELSNFRPEKELNNSGLKSLDEIMVKYVNMAY